MEISNFDRYAPIVALFVVVLPLLFWALFPGVVRSLFLIVIDLFTDHFDGRGAVTNSAPFTEADLAHAERLKSVPEYAPVIIKEMEGAAKEAPKKKERLTEVTELVLAPELSEGFKLKKEQGKHHAF